MSRWSWRDNGCWLLAGVTTVALLLAATEWLMIDAARQQRSLQVSIVREAGPFVGGGVKPESLTENQQLSARRIMSQLNSAVSPQFVLRRFSETDFSVWHAVMADLIAEGNPDLAHKLALELIDQSPGTGAVILDAADIFTKAGLDERAIGLYRQFLSHSPRHIVVRMRLAQALARRERHEEALAVYAPLVAWVSGEQKARVWAAQAESFQAVGRHREAVRVLKRAVQTKPERAPLWRQLAMAQWWMGTEATRVLQNLDRAIELRPQYLAALHQRGQVRWSAQQIDGARRDLQTVIRVAPDFSAARWTLLHFYTRQGQERSARTLLEELRGRTSVAKEHALLGLVEAVLNQDWRHAAQLIEKAETPEDNRWWTYYGTKVKVARHGDSGESVVGERGELDDPLLFTLHHLLLIEHWQDRERYRRAEALYNQLIARYPNSHRLINGLGRLWLAAGQPAKAIPPLQSAVESLPTNTQYQLSLALAYVRVERPLEAERVYRQLLDLNSGHKTGHYNYAILLDDLGRAGEAVRHYKRALAIDPEFVGAGYNLALIYQRQGKFRRSTELLDEVLRQEPTHEHARQQLAENWYRSGNYPRALSAIDRQLALRPDSSRALELKARVLRTEGKLRQAAKLILDLPLTALEPIHLGELFAIGEAAFQNGDWVLVELCNRRILQQDKTHTGALTNLTRALNQMQRFHETVGLLADRSAPVVDNKLLMDILAEAYRGLREHQHLLLTDTAELTGG